MKTDWVPDRVPDDSTKKRIRYGRIPAQEDGNSVGMFLWLQIM